MKDQMVELLAPAGSFDSVKAAVSAGADAVYMGGRQFGARAYARSAEKDRVEDALDYVHLYGKKLYLTVNTLVKEQELDTLPAFLMPYWERGLDGVIVQDFGVWKRVRECFPGLPVHVSTQMTVTDVHGAKWMEQLGADRIVTARELSLEELKQIRKQISIELEVFVHGAICYCYSGQCLMSSMIGGRSGNRGRCAQPCRLPYSLDQDFQNAGMTALTGRQTDRQAKQKAGSPSDRGGQKNRTGYLLSLKDMCTVEQIPQLLEAGVNSLKIEGRMKSPVYTAGVVSIYRKYVDLYLERGAEPFAVAPDDLRILLELFDRGGFTSYLRRHNGKDMIALEEKPAFRAVDQTVTKAIASAYVNIDLQRKIYGIVTLHKENPAKIVVSCGDVSCQLEGGMVEAARERPLTEDMVRRQITKTGGSDFVFETLDIDLDPDCFLGVQELNVLRRQALAQLKEAILNRYHKEIAEPGTDRVVKNAVRKPDDKAQHTVRENGAEGTEKQNGETVAGRTWNCETAYAGRRDADTDPQTDAIKLTVAVPDFSGGAWAVSEPGVDRVIVEAGPADDPGQLAGLSRLAHEHRTELFFRLPFVARRQDQDRLHHARKELESAGLDGLVVRNVGQAGLLCEYGFDLPVVLDHSVYTWNRQALAFLKQALGSRLLYETLPLELNQKELFMRGCQGAELVVYGYLPLMVTAGCVARTALCCDRKEKILRIRDRKRKVFPVRTVCRDCYNVIYNAQPLFLLDQAEEIRRLHPASIRLEYTIEPLQQQKALTGRWVRDWRRGMAILPEGTYTRGHFKRGVE